ncbi:MAG: hypothetical protein MI974_29615 [Chitinophagales bacterium]|nr:hypothetical protein [Chitinophagales bacterium]
MEEASIYVRLLAYLIVGVILAGGGFFIFPGFFPPDIDKVVEETNERLEYSKIDFLDIPFISPEKSGNSTKPRRSLIIAVDPEYLEKVVHFEIKQYTFETGGSQEKLSKEIKELFVAVDSVYNREDKIIEAIGEIEISAGFGKVFNISTKLKALSEILYALRRLLELKTNNVEIYVKGYADGTKNDWDEPLEKGYDGNDYRIFKVHPPTRPNSKNQFTFFKKEVDYHVPANYKNEHLPNLRARFMQLDIVDHYIKNHLVGKGISEDNISVGILNGYEFKTINHLDRKVEIFVNIY